MSDAAPAPSPKIVYCAFPRRLEGEIVVDWGEGETREAAALDYQQKYDPSQGSFCTAILHKPTIAEFAPDSNDILEMIAVRASDEAGEAAEDYLYPSHGDPSFDILEDRIKELINNWANEFDHQPRFFCFREVQDLTIDPAPVDSGE